MKNIQVVEDNFMQITNDSFLTICVRKIQQPDETFCLLTNMKRWIR